MLCEKAIKTPLDIDKCKSQLSKTGGTAYKFVKLEIEIDSDISLPLSALNSLRREALAELDEKRSKVHSYTINNVEIFENIQPFEGKKSRSGKNGRYENRKRL